MSFHAVEKLVAWASWLPRWLAPVLGGLGTGALACLLPQVMDARYAFIQGIMDVRFFGDGVTNWWWWAGLFGAVTLAKCVATSLTVGSGAAGGVLGPSLFIGGTTGAFLGAILEVLWPGTFPEPLRQSLIPVGIGGILAACMRAPLAAIIMVAEMTARCNVLPIWIAPWKPAIGCWQSLTVSP